MKQQIRKNPVAVFLACSTTKKSYENLFPKEQVEKISEYRNICEQMKKMKIKYPQIEVTIQ